MAKMYINSKISRWLGIVLIAIGLLFNKWFIGLMFAPGGVIQTQIYIYLIVIFQATAIIFGLFMVIKRPSFNIPVNKEKILKKRRELLLLAVTLLLFMLCFEVFLRMFVYEDIPEEKVIFVRHSHYNPFLVFGPPINRIYVQNITYVQNIKTGKYVYYNNQGFRMKEPLPLEKQPDEYRAFALGGSTTENLPNGQNLHYCGETNKILSNISFDGKYFNCVNAGTSAYSTAHSLIRLQFDLLKFKPDMVIVMHNINDLTVNFFPYDERNNYANKYLHNYYAPTPKQEDKPLIESIKVVDFTHSRLKKIKKRLLSDKVYTKDKKPIVTAMRFNPNPTELKSKDNFRNNLIAITSICKAHNITVVLMSQPATFSEDKIALAWGHKIYNPDILYPHTDEWIKLFEEYNEVIESVAKEEGVYFIDMYSLLGHNESYFFDMLHYTPEGIKRFSEIYSNELEKIIEKELE